MLQSAAGRASDVIVVESDVPSLVALIVAEPAASAVILPVPSTWTLAGSELLHVISRPLSTLLSASYAVTVSWPDCPTYSAPST